MATETPDPPTPRDAQLLARGVCRRFDAMAQATLTEFTLRSGRRADVMALDEAGRFSIVEIKTSVADFRADLKWPEYLEFCDRFYFAVPMGFPLELLPDEHGLIVADRFDAEILRPSPELAMAGARRKALTLRFARQASARLHRLVDPPLG